MEKLFPNLKIRNLEALRDLDIVFNIRNISDSKDIEVGLWQPSPNYTFTYLSLWTRDFQVVFHGYGEMEIIPNKHKVEHGEFIYADKEPHIYDTHNYLNFSDVLRMIFGDDIAEKYNYILNQDEQWHSLHT